MRWGKAGREGKAPHCQQLEEKTFFGQCCRVTLECGPKGTEREVTGGQVRTASSRLLTFPCLLTKAPWVMVGGRADRLAGFLIPLTSNGFC